MLGKTINAFFIKWLKIQTGYALVHIDEFGIDYACYIKKTADVKFGDEYKFQFAYDNLINKEIILVSI